MIKSHLESFDVVGSTTRPTALQGTDIKPNLTPKNLYDEYLLRANGSCLRYHAAEPLPIPNGDR